ncbi:hypothetical protein F4774DRAFT_328921 [Daldinia eschscholtzii]|nr:hypothetical protein F4774DRAFT_328921 [Daldinia eschscholtzii]
MSYPNQLDAQSRSSKRNREAYEEKDSLSLPTAPSSSPFQRLRVTKSKATNGSTSFSNLQSIQAQHNIKQDQFVDPRYITGHTSIEQLTPCSTSTLSTSGNQQNYNGAVGPFNELNIVNNPPVTPPYIPKSIDASRNLSHGNLVSTAVVGRPTSLAHLTTLTTLGNAHPCSSAGNDNEILSDPPKAYNLDTDTCEDVQDEYPLDDDLMEEDMAYLLETTLDSVQEAHMPPPSVTQAWDCDSRSAVEYDPTLQYSSPEEPSAPQMVDIAESSDSNQDDLLDEDVDWNVVYTMTSTIPNNASSTYLRDAAHTCQANEVDERGAHIADTVPLKPFVRPPFPEKVRDRSAVSELSPRTVLRTCFRVGEMVNQAVYCLNHRQDVIFELFARVTYSSRESLQRNQHFQFIDLFKDQLPYPVGVLSNWRVGTQLDHQSAAFLGTNAGPKLCRCVCKPRRDPKVAIGLTLVITAIKEIDWAHVRLAKKTVCGGSDDAARDVVTQ